MSKVPNSNDKTLEAQPEIIVEPSETKQKTKTEIFTERLNAYPDLETAKTHLKEIADELGVAKSLGYKALKQTRWALEEAKIPKPEVPTVKIPEAPTEPIAEEIPKPQAPLEVEAELPPVREPVVIEAPPAIPAREVVTPTMEKLEPILERAIGRLFNYGIETITGAKEMLTDQEAKDTAILMPILVWRITKVSLSEEQFIDMTAVTHFGSIIVKVVSKKMAERRETQRKEKEKPIEAKAPEPKKPASKPQTEQDLNKLKEEQHPKFIEKLG